MTSDVVDMLLGMVSLAVHMPARGVRLRRPDGSYPFVRMEGYPRPFEEAQDCARRSESGPEALRCACGDVLRQGPTGSCSTWTNDGVGALVEPDGHPTPCRDLGFGSLAVIPIRSGEPVHGVLHVADVAADKLDTAQVERLEQLAKMLARVLDRLALLRAEVEAARKVAVLVAEDDDAVRRTLEKLLVRFGYECVSARDGEAAWELLLTRRFDVLLTDIEMPRLSGLALVARMRERLGPYAPAVLVCTGRPQHVPSEVAKEHGIAGVLPKPLVSLSLLDELVRSAAARAS